MPPRAAAKKTPPAAGPGGAAAKRKVAAKASSKPPAAAPEAAAQAEAVAKAEAEAAAAAEAARIEAAEAEAADAAASEAEANGAVDSEAKEDTKESFEEDNEDQLELEDHEQEDPEEETAVDYDGQEEDSEREEIGEEGDSVEEDEAAEMVEEGMEDGAEGEGEEDVEGEENVQGEEEEEVDPEEAEHHEVVKEHRKRKEFEVFVGGLDKDVIGDDLKKVFSKVGEVTEVRLMMNALTKKNRGFAFLRFATVEQAKRAVSEMKNPVVNGKQCGVNPSQDSDTLFVGNICKTWTKEYLKDKLKSHGIENIEDLTLVEDTKNEGMNRGFAFLEFSSRSEAMAAYKCLRKKDAFLGTDRIAKVSFADSFSEPDDEVMSQVKTVFVDGLPASWDEDRVKECLKKYGVIEKVDLARNMPSARRKDFGFVIFETHDNAVACAEGLNSVDLGEGDNKVKVRARLARPRQRGGGNFGISRGATRDGRGGVPRGTRGRLGMGRGASGRVPYGRPSVSRLPLRLPRGSRDYETPIRSREFRRPAVFRGRHPGAVREERPRRLPPPERPYTRRPPTIPVYPKHNLKAGYVRREAPPPRRTPVERPISYKEDYPSRKAAYSNVAPRSDPRVASRRDFAADGYRQTHERPTPSYQGNTRDYAPASRSKRPYSEMDDAPRYSSVNTRQTRARLDYEVTGNTSEYADTYADRLERYSSRRALSDHDGLYRSRQAADYNQGSLSGNEGGGLYSSSLSSRYPSDGSNVGGGHYSSMYSGRSLGGGDYLGGGGSGSSYY